MLRSAFLILVVHPGEEEEEEKGENIIIL